ncbi:MAG: hypothetical protein QQW96_13720 [Tychonema bourrellyi B0820]|nr:hypothetical protein [Tychonema bourrellyi B0820]
MPVPQKLYSIVERASCPLFLTYLFKNRQDACSTKTLFYCGTGILVERASCPFLNRL